MEYVITDGKNYISSKGGIKPVSNINKADKWDLEKAYNVMKSIPKTLKLFDWKCVPFNDEKQQDAKKPIVNKSLDEYNGLTDNILDRMMDWERYIKQLKDYMETINDQLSLVDLEICDILHAAEFYDFDMFRAWKLYKMLQDARRRRRKIKDERIKVEYILNSNFVDCTNNAISKYIKNLENRKYKPRVLKELFDL